VKVLDFGIAKLRDMASSHLTETGTVMGTPSYMSPEQCMAEELDNRSDIYSLRIVMYEMLCGVVPFKAPALMATSIQHVTQTKFSIR
jgi:serine/threonine-protein kinase